MIGAIPTVTGITVASALAKSYESKAFRNLLIRLNNTKKGSKQESRAFDLASTFVASELQAAKKEQEKNK